MENEKNTIAAIRRALSPLFDELCEDLMKLEAEYEKIPVSTIPGAYIHSMPSQKPAEPYNHLAVADEVLRVLIAHGSTIQDMDMVFAMVKTEVSINLTITADCLSGRDSSAI